MPTAKPAVSDRKRAANKANAQKSTGPRTAEGKARARNNAIRHGLRAEQVVLPWEDAEAFEEMRRAWVDDWKPPTDARRALVELAVAQAWAVRRGIGQHRDRLAELGYAAMDRHDREVEARVTRGLNLLSQRPEHALGMLTSDRAGVEALAGLWAELAEDLESPSGWSDPRRHHGGLLNLLGHRAETPFDRVGEAADASCLLLQYNDPTQLPDGDPPVEPEEAEEAAGLLRELAATMIGRLGGALAALPDPEEARLDAARAAAFDPSKEGLIRLRYMAHHERSFRGTLDQLMRVTRTGVDLVAGDDPEPQVVETAPVAIPAPDAPNEATEAVAVVPATVAAAPGADAPNEATAAVAAPEVVAPNEATAAVAAPEVVAPNEATAAVAAPGVVAPNEATEAGPGRASTRDREGRVWPISALRDDQDGPGTDGIGDEEVIPADDGASPA